MERKSVDAGHIEHHTHAPDALDLRGREKGYFTDITDQILGAARILLIGPGVTKHHFLTYLQEHFPGLAKRVLGCETVDHPSDVQIAAMARKAFRLGGGSPPA